MVKTDKKSVFNEFKLYFIYFMVYCILGWLYEVFLEVVIYRWGFSNRGLLFGPYLPVYGVGSLIIMACVGSWIHKKIKIGKINITPLLAFIGIVILTTAIELIASYLLEWTTGGWLWDYTTYKYHFEGRISISPSVRFGLGGMVILYIIQPFLEKIAGKMTDKAKNIVFTIMFVPFCLDWIWTIVKMRG